MLDVHIDLRIFPIINFPEVIALGKWLGPLLSSKTPPLTKNVI